MIGRRVAHYEIVNLLGRGGMGEVYRARDAKLGRDVAIKVLPREVSGDPERLARFSREARTLAALQHPNVASIYGFEEIDGVRFLVMELAEGEDLSVHLRKGPIPLELALDVAHQIAEGLEAAHEKGIVHRDLKPANVKIDGEHRVKILDFGLARAMQGDAGADGDLANSPTITAAMTQQGVILGTAAYMSPEQARGGVADARADVWAFGVLLWEMITGKRLFEGETVSDTLASVLKTPPDWSQLPADVPPRLRELLERCLAKKRRDRLGSISDARIAVEWIRDGRGESSPVAATRAGGSSSRWPWIAAALALSALGFFVGRTLSSAPAESAVTPAYSLAVVVPDHLVHLGELMSPDGSVIAVRARPRNPATPAEARQALYLRRFDRDEFRLVQGSSGLLSYGFSRDGRWLGMVAPASAGSSQMRFWRVAVDGSAPATALFNWADEWSRLFLWLPDGDLLVDLENRRFLRVPTDGRSPGAPIDLVLKGGLTGFEAYPRPHSILPDGRHVLTWSHSYATGRYDQTGALLDLQTGEMKPLLTDTGPLVYWPTGHLLFGRGGSLLAVEFDLDRLHTVGAPFAVASGIRQRSMFDHPSFDLSDDGKLVYYPGSIGGDARRWAWVDATYRVLEPWSDDRRAFTTPTLVSNPAGRLVLTIIGNDGLFSAWTSEIERPRLEPWVSIAGSDVVPIGITRDGGTLLYAFTDGVTAALRQRGPDGVDVSLMEMDVNEIPSPAVLLDDDRTLVFTLRGPTPTLRMLALPSLADVRVPDERVPSVQETTVLIENASNVAASPDGRWIAFESSITGGAEVYVRAWQGAGRLGPPTRISREGGFSPEWYRTADGMLEVRYFLAGALHAVTFDPATQRPSAPRTVHESPESFASMVHLGDGRILALLLDDDEKPVTHIGVRTDFGAELQRALAAKDR
jgi:serine/threonine protein kinase